MIQILPYALLLAFVAALVLAEGHQVPAWKVAAHGLLCAAVLAAGIEVQGRAKPLWAEWRNMDEMEVVAAQYHPGEGIYVWVRSAPPVQYALPWDVRLAREMQEAVRVSGGAVLRKADGGEHRDGGEGGEWEAHPLPQPDNPPKEVG